MRKLQVRPLKPVLSTGAVILLSSLLTGTVHAQNPYSESPLAKAIDASLTANAEAAQNYASHDSHLLFNNCINFALPPYNRVAGPDPHVTVPDFSFSSHLKAATTPDRGRTLWSTPAFACKQSGPFTDLLDPSTTNSQGQPDPKTGWYLQEIEGIEIKDTDADRAAVCRVPVPSVPADAFLTRICNPRAIQANGGKEMAAPCWNPMYLPGQNMTGPGGCAPCYKQNDPAGNLCHDRLVISRSPH